MIQPPSSLLDSLLVLPDEERAALIQELSPKAATDLLWDWSFWARPTQLPPPGDWHVWLLMAGRGAGKTRAGAEWLRAKAQEMPNARFALIGQTAADVRDVMIRGESGLLAVSPPWFRPVYNPSLRLLSWPNGAEAHTYSGDSPDQLRGPQHHGAWADEPAKWSYLTEAWDNMEMGLRLGTKPQVVATTTPRPVPLLRRLLADPRCVVMRGHTFDNAENLPESYIDRLRMLYQGSRLGRQELAGELLEDREGALWQREAMIDAHRVTEAPEIVRIVVAVDPSISDNEDAAECGIVAAGIDTKGHGYVLEDRSRQGSPLEWAREVVACYSRLKANKVVAEANQGGKMVESTLRTVKLGLPLALVHASKAKQARAEPVSALYEQGRIHHLGSFPELEDQMCLVGDTLVLTSQGEKPIREIRAGDQVQTRNGWRRVFWAGQTGEALMLASIRTTDNRHLLTTVCHPVYTKERGFVPAGSLSFGDRLEAREWRSTEGGAGVLPARTVRPDDTESMGRRSSGTDGCGAARKMAITVTQKASSSIKQYGRRLMDLFLRAWRFTTGTKTERTTRSGIWRLLPASSTSPTIPGMGFLKWTSLSAASYPVESGVNASRCPESVPGAASGLRAQECERATVPALASRSSITTVTKIAVAPTPVYNLMVEETPEFYANGILVHNCGWVPGEPSPDRLDALVWAMTELFGLEEPQMPAFLGMVSGVGVKSAWANPGGR